MRFRPVIRTEDPAQQDPFLFNEEIWSGLTRDPTRRLQSRNMFFALSGDPAYAGLFPEKAGSENIYQ